MKDLKWLLPLLLMLPLLHGYMAAGFYRVPETEVKDVILWQNGPNSQRITLNREEIAAFLKSYNRADYRGRADGSGGTAEWGAVIVKQDGMEIRVHEFSGGADFEVSCDQRDWWFYLDSGELREFILLRLEED